MNSIQAQKKQNDDDIELKKKLNDLDEKIKFIHSNPNPNPQEQLNLQTANGVERHRVRQEYKLYKYLRRCVLKDQLIGRIMTHFHRKDTMTKAEYETLRGDDFKSKFYGGIKCAVHNLQNTSRPWLRSHQDVHGSIISIISPTEIRVRDTWKRLIQNALS
jgi:alanine racemase